MKKSIPYFFLFFWLLFVSKAFAQVPVISYAGSPYSVPVGSAITSITPNNTGGSVGSYSAVATFSTVASKASVITYDPVSAAFYAVEYVNGYLDKITTAGAYSQINTPVISANAGYSIVTDGLGNIFVSDAPAGNVYEFNNTGTLLNTITGFTNPSGLAVDAGNNVYVVDGTATGVIYKIATGTNTKTPFLSGGFTTPFGIAINSAGDFYISQDGTVNNVIKITGAVGGGSTKAVFATGFTTPRNLTLDAAGNVFVADYGAAKVEKITTAGVVSTIISTGVTTPGQVTFDASGNLYIADLTKSIKKSTATYYTISGSLPLGLSFNYVTGAVTGTPTATGSSTVTITAANSSGTSVAATLTINVTPKAPVITYTTPDAYTTTSVVSLSPTNTGGAVVTYSAPSLPAGLLINASTGVISGTPTAASAATNYTISATNTGGTGTFVINIAVTLAQPPNLSYAGNPYTFTAGVTNTTAAISNTGGVVAGSYTLNILTGALPAGITFSSTTGTFNCVPTAAGAATFTVTAGNASGSSTTPVTSITVNNPPIPAFTYTTPDTYQVGTAISFLSPSNSGGTPTSYAAVSLPAGLSINTSTGVITGTPTTATAAVNYTINATNTAGTGSFIISITVLPKAPVITYTTPDVYTVGTAIGNLTPNASGGGAVVSYTISPALPSGLSIDPVTGIISGTPTAITASGTYTVTAVNIGGSGNFAINITVNAPIPVISYTTPDVYTVNTVITQLSPANTGGTPVSYSAASLPAGLSINNSTGVISGTPTAIATATNYIVSATNTGGTANFTISITVNPKPPVITYTTPDTYTAGTAISTLSPTNTGGAPASYAVSPSLPGGLSLNTATGVITGTPTAATGAANYVVTATNAGGSGNFTINITVNNPPAPVISYTTPDTYTVGTAITALSPTTTGGAAVSYAATLPAGLAINTTTGVISGTPTTAAAAANYMVTATNAGGSGNFTINITVNPKAPVISYTTPNTWLAGTAYSLSPINTGGLAAGYTLSGTLAPGLSFNTGTGVISGTPTSAMATTTYTITATNVTGPGTAYVVITVNQPTPVLSYTTPDVYTVGTAIATVKPFQFKRSRHNRVRGEPCFTCWAGIEYKYRCYIRYANCNNRYSQLHRYRKYRFIFRQRGNKYYC